MPHYQLSWRGQVRFASKDFATAVREAKVLVRIMRSGNQSVETPILLDETDGDEEDLD